MYKTLRTFINRAGLVFNEAKNSIIFAEDLNDITNNLDYLKSDIENKTHQSDGVMFETIFRKNKDTTYEVFDTSLHSIYLANSLDCWGISCPLLETVETDITLASNNMLDNLSFPVLTSIVGGFYCDGNNSLMSIDMTSLTYGSIRVAGFGYTVIEFPSFIGLTTNNIYIENNNYLQSINIPNIMYGGLSIQNNPALANLYLGAFLGDQFTSQLIVGNTSLTDIAISDDIDFATLNLEGNALSEECVNRILIQLNAQGKTGRIIHLIGGSNSAPSGLGITAMEELIARGNTVAVNS